MKKILTVLMLFLLFLPTNSFAHTAIKDSNPKKNEVVTAPVSNILLTFQTKVEIGSHFEISNEKKEMIKPDSINIEKNLLKGTFNEPLANGSYSLNWSIIGADGHFIKGEIPFSIQVEATEEGGNSIQPEEIHSEEEEMTTNSTEEKKTLSSSNNLSAQKSMTKAVENTKEAQNESELNQKNNSNSYRILYSGIGAVIIVISILLWRGGKKR